jgi:hypothetical protein
MRALTALAAAGLGVLGACGKSTAERAPLDAGAPVVAAASAPSAPTAAAPVRHMPRASLACRAIGVDGIVEPMADDETDGGPPGPALAVDRELSAGRLSLAPGARLVVKDPRTSRETTFIGPGRARACVGEREESWLYGGRFESSLGAGEGPGAEEWVVTPVAVVRYTAAQVRVDVKGELATIAVGVGDAFVWMSDDAHVRVLRLPDAGASGADAGGREDESDLPWRRVAGATWQVTVAGALDSHLAVEACRARAARSRDLAVAVLSRDDAGRADAGREVADQVRERRLARAACALAAVRLGTAPSKSRAADADAIREADEAWREIPLAQGRPR